MRLLSRTVISTSLLALLLISVIMHKPALAQDEPDFPPLPSDYEQVDVYLLTIGRGQAPAALFGHTILRVVDRARRLDMNFNWGMFDFHAPGFLWTFYRGDLDYKMVITDFRSLHENYLLHEKRGMIQDRITLTSAQKERLMKRLAWNAKSENVSYKYQQFYDNCATRVRDYLDEALLSRVREATDHQTSPNTFRHWIRHGSSATWWVYLGLDVLLNAKIDQRLTPWQEMFLPSMTRQHLKDLPAYDDRGDPIPGSTLLTAPTVLIPLPDPPAQRDPYAVTALVISLPITLVVLLLVRRRAALLAPGRALATAFGGTIAVYGLISALIGTVLPLNWAFSQYPELQHNAYLMLFWPLDWALLLYGIVVCKRGELPRIGSRLARFVAVLSGAHLVSLGALALAAMTDIVQQSVLAGVAAFGPAADRKPEAPMQVNPLKTKDKTFRKAKAGDSGALYDLLESERGEIYDYMMRMTGQITRSAETIDEVFQSLTEDVLDTTSTYMDLKILLFTTARKFNADIWGADTSRLTNSALEAPADDATHGAKSERECYLLVDRSLRTLPSQLREAAILKARHRFALDHCERIMGLAGRDIAVNAGRGLKQIADECPRLEATAERWVLGLPAHAPPIRTHHGTMNLSDVMQGLKVRPIGQWSLWRTAMIIAVIGSAIAYYVEPKIFVRVFVRGFVQLMDWLKGLVP